MIKFGDFRDLLAYKKAFEHAMNIFKLTTQFPKEEKYSLTDQIRRSSRSVCTNLAEAYRKRTYPKHYYLKLTDCLCENSETLVWLNFALNCEYMNQSDYNIFIEQNSEVGKLISYMMNNPDKFGVNVKEE